MASLYSFGSIYEELVSYYKEAISNTKKTKHFGKSQAILQHFDQKIKENLETLDH